MSIEDSKAKQKPSNDDSVHNFFTALTAGGEGVLEMRPLARGTFAPAGRKFLTLDHLNDELTVFLHEHHRDHNYFAMALRKDATSGTLENCTTLSVLYTDIDFKHTPEAEARRLLAEFPLAPSIIVQSGGGLHVYWLLREPLDLQDQADRAQSYSLLRRLCAFLQGDTSVAEPAHILRVPGTLNYKYDPPRLVQIELMEADRQYNVNEFADFLPPEMVCPPPETNPYEGDAPLLGEVEEMLTYISPNEYAMWRDVGIILGRVFERSSAAWAVYGRWAGKWCGKKGPRHDEQMRDFFETLSQQETKTPLGIGTIIWHAIQNGWLPKCVRELNQTYAVVWLEGDCKILREHEDPAFGHKTVSFCSKGDLKLWLAPHPKVVVGKTKVEVVDYWLRHPGHRSYPGLTFLPGPESRAGGHYNLWRGFAVKARAGDVSLYLAHLRENIAAGNVEHERYVLAWMANIVQRPTERPGTALVLRGKQGVGKGLFATGFGSLFGQHFRHITHGRHLVGHFNAPMKQALVVFADEAFWAGDKQAEGTLNGLITEPTTQIELKGIDPVTVNNYLNFIIASNHDWVVPAGMDARRFCVLDVGDAHKEDIPYFTALTKQMDSGGREALLDYLMHYDYTGVDLRHPPKTEALAEQKQYSMSPVEKFWHGCLMTGANTKGSEEWHDWVESTPLHDWYIQQTGKTGVNRKATETELGIQLKKLVPHIKNTQRAVWREKWVVNPKTQEREDHGKTARPHGWEVKDLKTCRMEFDRITACTHPWRERICSSST